MSNRTEALSSEHAWMGDRQHQCAREKYGRRYNPHVYGAAVEKLNTESALLLWSDAMAICGSPFHKISGKRWSVAAMRFLELFVDTPGHNL